MTGIVTTAPCDSTMTTRGDGPAQFDRDDVSYGARGPVEVREARFDRPPIIERREVRSVRRGNRRVREIPIIQEPRPFYRDMHRDDDRRRIWSPCLLEAVRSPERGVPGAWALHRLYQTGKRA